MTVPLEMFPPFGLTAPPARTNELRGGRPNPGRNGFLRLVQDGPLPRAAAQFSSLQDLRVSQLSSKSDAACFSVRQSTFTLKMDYDRIRK